MSLPAACIFDEFEGDCSICDGKVKGHLVEGEFVTIEGRQYCTLGSVGKDEAGHTCSVVGCSSVLYINGKPVARIGDPVEGTIVGKITTGSGFVLTD